MGLTLPQGDYVLQFDARAEQQDQLLITVSKNYPDWGSHLSEEVTITTTEQHYQLTLRMPVNEDNARLYFGLGRFSGRFTIDNISLRPRKEPAD